MDELARKLGMDPIEFRERNIVQPGDPMISTGAEEGHDVEYGSYGLDQCLALVKDAIDRGGGLRRRRPTTGWSDRALRSA